MGEGIEGTIASPASLETLDYETDWFEIRLQGRETFRFRLKALEGGALRPMLTLLSTEGKRAKGPALAVVRADGDQQSIERRIRIESDGVKLIAVDDARNVEGNAARSPAAPVGGQQFGYRLSVERVDP